MVFAGAPNCSMVGVDPPVIAVEVVYASSQCQRLIELSVPAGARVAEVIAASGILREFPEIDLAVNRVGIFGQMARLDDIVHSGERVEIYRPLQADPKETRRRRAQAKRSAGKRE